MLAVRGELPDVDGALVKSVFEHLVERMRPPKRPAVGLARAPGAPTRWSPCARRYADAVPTGRSRPQIVVQHPVDRPPEVDGIPIAARDPRRPARRGDRSTTSSSTTASSSRLCDPVGRSRRQDRTIPCTTRPRTVGSRAASTTRRLQNHHLVPGSWGGSRRRPTTSQGSARTTTDSHTDRPYAP